MPQKGEQNLAFGTRIPFLTVLYQMYERGK